jgi:hypothetical protein
MPIDADTSRLPLLLQIWITGEYPTPEERVAFRRELSLTEGFTPKTVALVDLRGITSLPGSIPVPGGGRDWLSRRAYVADLGTVAYGFARQIIGQAARDEVIAVFCDEGEARAWVLSDAPSPMF